MPSSHISCRHISWLEEKGLNGLESYPKALKKCISYFGQTPHYNSDIRLAEIYIKLVSLGAAVIFCSGQPFDWLLVDWLSTCNC